ncbi:CPBP family intramembrane glutamic endopeptidase [Spirosoma linguale]|uniref:Abortive infection protein n=1 Tax=Spirosoma linguale (strain ATCC 33905 / DSM 74 / LMG 10896 / Claus 1) TaxID=504472 RepID=D2QGT4_SPILD|nr:Abortive infection protein [Spirosoma linguale DSM 74]
MTNSDTLPSEEHIQPILPSENAYPTLTEIWILVGVFILAQVPAALPMIGLKAAADAFELPFLDTIGQTLAYALGMMLTIWYAFRKRGSRALSFASVPVSAYLVSAVGLIAMGVLAEPIVSAIPMPDAMQEMIKKMFNKNMVVSAVIAAPVLEEILFRGIILDGFLKNYRPAKAIIWSGVIFGLIHLIPAQALNAAFIGIALGWLYYRTRSLTLCMFLHFVNNGLSSLSLLTDEALDMSQNQTREWIGSDLMYGTLLIGCLLTCLASYRHLNRILPTAQIN